MPSPCIEAGNASVTCESLNATLYNCNYTCDESYLPIDEEDISKGCLGKRKD